MGAGAGVAEGAGAGSAGYGGGYGVAGRQTQRGSDELLPSLKRGEANSTL